MMLAPTVRSLLKRNAQKLGIKPDYVYSYSIDPNIRANDEGNLVTLITEMDDTPRDYGSNHPLNREANIQIQIYIPQNYQGDTSKLRNNLAELMDNANWFCTLDEGIEQDPSSDVLVNLTRWRSIH